MTSSQLHRVVQSEKRKLRYKTDSQYRELIKQKAREYQQKKREQQKPEKRLIKRVRKGISIFRQEQIRTFLSSRSAFNLSELGRLSGWNTTSFLAWVKEGNNMPDKVLDKLTGILKDYGYPEKRKSTGKGQC